MSSARYGVRNQTKTRRQNTLVCSQHVSELAASATATKPARYGCVVRFCGGLHSGTIDIVVMVA